MYLASARGDYLRSSTGDPGIFGSIGRAIGGVAKIGGSLLPGPIGGAMRGLGGLLAPTRPSPTSLSPPRSRGIALPGLPRGGPMGIGAYGERYEGYRGSLDVPAQVGGGCPKGYRLNKSSYFTKDGQFHQAGTKCVKYRYRNVANGRALKRAISRTAAFDKMVKSNRKALRALAKI